MILAPIIKKFVNQKGETAGKKMYLKLRVSIKH